MKKNKIGKRIAEARINLNITQEQIQSPTVKDAVTVLSQMNERQAQYMLDIIKIYQASHQD